MRRIAASLVLLAACGGSTPPTSTAPRNEGGAASPEPDASLRGPFARIEDAPYLASSEPATVTTLGSASGPIAVSLAEVRHTSAAASCVVALQTDGGFYTGEDFLCSALRSDETIVTDGVAISIDGGTATVQFRTSYQLEQETPTVETYTVTCDLGPILHCTAPPAIGGYDSSFSMTPP